MLRFLYLLLLFLILQLPTYYYKHKLQKPYTCQPNRLNYSFITQMGQTNFGQIDQKNRDLHQKLSFLKVKNLHDYHFVTKRDDQSIVVHNNQNQQYYLLRILTASAQEDAFSLAKILQKRNKINSVHLCKIVAVQKSQQNLACSQIHRLHLLIQCPSKSLKDLLQQKISHYQSNKPKQFFKQQQLWGIAYSVVKALKSIYLYGMVHESLSLESILIDQKGLIKVADPVLFGLQKNYISAMKQKNKCTKILSPQILVFIDEFNFYFYEKQKSDIFIFGILLLQLSTLNEFPVYDFNEKTARFQLIQIKLNQIKNRYSPKYYAMLEWMTQIQPKKRPKLGELLDFIDKNNFSQKSTSIQNTIAEFSPSIQNSKYQKNLEKNKTVSQFNFESVSNTQYRPLIPTQSRTQMTQKVTKQEDNKKRNQTQQSKSIFPFQLVYNRIISNNQNMKPFEIQQLCKQYRYNEMFGSSCRGSVPNSSYHAKIQLSSKDVPHRNMKFYDAMAFSKNSLSKGDNLVYSQSSAFQGSNNGLQFSKNTLGDIKLVESNHHKEQIQPRRFVKEQYFRASNIIEDPNQHSSIQSPYRRLTSQRNSEGKSLTSIKYLDVEPTINKQNKQLSKSDILQQYEDDTKNINTLSGHQNDLQSRYFSQEKQKDLANSVRQNNFFTSHSQFLNIQPASQNQNKIYQNTTYQIQENYEKYLLSDKIINKESLQNLQSKKRIITFQSSQFESKLSRLTPNFAQKSHRQNGSQKQIMFKQFNSTDANQLMFVSNAVQQDGSIYTGYKNKQGLKERHGRLEFSDGGFYQGQWKNDKMQGYGQLHYGNGTVAYKGLWFQGCFSGNGQIFNDKPEYFQEPFDYRNFTEIEDKWLSYEGQFENDSKHGRGRINLTNGEYFQGSFDYDMIEGNGTFYRKNGPVISGLWRDNQLIQQYE